MLNETGVKIFAFIVLVILLIAGEKIGSRSKQESNVATGIFITVLGLVFLIGIIRGCTS